MSGGAFLCAVSESIFQLIARQHHFAALHCSKRLTALKIWILYIVTGALNNRFVDLSNAERQQSQLVARRD